MDSGRSNHSVQKFVDSSIALIEARPNTTRIVSRYRVQTEKDIIAAARKHGSKSSKEKEPSSTGSSSNPIGFYQIKTYDPISGACLRIKIRKASELNRILNVLGEVIIFQLSGQPSETTKPLDKNIAIRGIRATKLQAPTSFTSSVEAPAASADAMDLDHKVLQATVSKSYAQSSSGTASPSTAPSKSSKKKKNKRR